MDEFDAKFPARLWIWDGPNPWYFITVPKKESGLIRSKFRSVHRGWGSIPVSVRIGGSVFKTSIFWEKKGTYLLPVKKSVRSSEKITSGDKIEVEISIKAEINY